MLLWWRDTILLLFFFFQAEDGIRDVAVTGVQTCALPICEEEERRAVLEVAQEDIEEVISKWTGIPISSVKKEEAERLLKMEEFLHRRIVGQDEAISALARATRRQRAGLKNPVRPVGPLICLGPPAVGKTE